MIRFITEHRVRFGVEAICRVLRLAVRGFITSRGYRAALRREPSARALSDQVLGAEIERLHGEIYGVYGARKMHALMLRQGWTLGRDQTARLMRQVGVRGVIRSKRVFTTKSDPTGARPTDLVNRQFHPDAPRRLWVADVTYVRTWAGFAYVAFVTDAFSRRIVGWNVASTLRADVLPLQALNMAAWDADGDLGQLTHHSDHGSNYMALVYTDRIVELGATPSTGTVGDRFDNALAEAVNGLYKTELIRQGPWRTVEQVEIATLEYVWWWNNQRLHGSSECGPPTRQSRRTTLASNHPWERKVLKPPNRNETQGITFPRLDQHARSRGQDSRQTPHRSRRQALRDLRPPRVLCRTSTGDPQIRIIDPRRAPFATRQQDPQTDPVPLCLRSTAGPRLADLLRQENAQGKRHRPDDAATSYTRGSATAPSTSPKHSLAA